MSTRKDPLLEFESPERVYYSTGVLLDATDFQAEQTYHRGRLARALAYLHGYGTAAGLLVEHESASKTPPKEEEIVVHPGIALDPLGRLCEVPRKACVRVKRWYAKHAPDELLHCTKDVYKPALSGSSIMTFGEDNLPAHAVLADVFLRFRTRDRGHTPSFAVGAFDATDAVEPARLGDGYELCLVMRNEKTEDPTVPRLPLVPSAPWPLAAGGKPLKIPAPADLEGRKAALRETILSSWHADRAAHLQAIRKDEFLPFSMTKSPGVEGGDEDPAWVFLARVVVGVDPGALVDSRPALTGVVMVDNDTRPFALSSAAMAWWLGL